MIRRSVARAVGLCLTGTGILLFASAANAAPAPDGSYQQSCRNFAASHGTLTAECKNRNGDWGSTQLADYRSCTGDIANNNGQLTCQQGNGAQGAGTTGGQGSGGTGQGTGGPGHSGTGGQGTGITGPQGAGGTGHGDDHNTGGHDDHSAGGHDQGDNDRNNGDRRDTPQGSYKDSCRNVHIEGDVLIAECRARDGDWNRTSLDNYRQCQGDVSNDNGRLTCQRGDEDRRGRGDWDRQGGGDEPRGSYQQTCRRIRADHGDLEADCRTRDGDWRHSSLDNFRDCHGEIANDNGRLVCVRGDRDRSATITLFKDSRYKGRRQSFNTDVPDLSTYDFADKASSAYVQGGVWQLCTRPDYRGRCVTLNGNVANFQSLGINDRAESLRRVR